MKKLLTAAYLMSILFLIAGCSNAEQETPVFLDASIKSDKQNVKVNETFTITVDVKFGEKDISKDTNVEIEFIDNGVSVGSVNPEYQGDGQYALEMMLISKGEHTIVAHVYYGEYYEMPFLSLNVTE